MKRGRWRAYKLSKRFFGTRMLPNNLIFLFEGEEMLSPSLKPFIKEHKMGLSAFDSILCLEGRENKLIIRKLVSKRHARFTVSSRIAPTRVISPVKPIRPIV